MEPGGGSRFDPALRRVAAGLDLPVRTKAAILAELQSDLEGLYRHYRRRGVPPAEATRRAQERLAPGAGTVRELVRLHARGWRRLAGRLSDRARRGVEHAVLGGAALLALAAALLLVRATGPLPSSDPLVWTVLGIGGLVLAGGVAAAVYLYLLRAWSPGLARLGLPGFAVAGGSALAIGLFGGLLRLHRAAVARATGRLDELELVVRLGRESTLAATSLCVAFAAGALGFLVVSRVRALQEEDVARLL